MASPKNVHVAITLSTDAKGHSVGEAALSTDGKAHPAQKFQGQNANHALAIALEALARRFRKEAEAEQKVDWEHVEHSADGKAVDKRFHIVLHYETVANEESKFEAMHNTRMGNTVVENAEISLVQIDPALAVPRWKEEVE